VDPARCAPPPRRHARHADLGSPIRRVTVQYVSASAPPNVALPEPHPDAPLPGTALGQHYVGCFGCGDLEGGLRMRFTTGEDLTVTGTFTVQAHHQGAAGLAHGGLLTTAFDEALGALQVYFMEPAVTASLEMQFRRPVPVGTELHLECRVDGRDGRKLWVSGDARLDAPDGPVAARASALFVFVSEEHFTRHRRSQDVAAPRAERAVNP
jgi:acyl-coenzyme A thioesterase PaaI-like protein